MDAFLTYDQIQYWRVINTIKGWNVSAKDTKYLADSFYNLNPRFIYGSEEVVFWTCLSKTRDIAISELRYNGRKFGEGIWNPNHVIATESRLIVGKERELYQISYDKIMDVVVDGSKFLVKIAGESGLEFSTRFPKPSRLGSFLQMAGPPEQRLFVNSIERQKAEVGSEFLSYFLGFFEEIARQNRR